jgi:hypothetical protein
MFFLLTWEVSSGSTRDHAKDNRVPLFDEHEEM